MNFLVDNQLPEALCGFLRESGHQSDHVLNLRIDEASYADIWDYIKRSNQILVSKDEDFLHLANRPSDTGRLLWVRIGNYRKQVLLRSFERQLPPIVRAFGQGIRIVEIRWKPSGYELAGAENAGSTPTRNGHTYSEHERDR